jgi:hypothetical protein
MIFERSIKNWQSADMARPRKFDADAAVEAAMETFWTKGHTATSTEMLRGSVSDQLRDP